MWGRKLVICRVVFGFLEVELSCFGRGRGVRLGDRFMVGVLFVDV